jgi:hypothetical protein
LGSGHTGCNELAVGEKGQRSSDAGDGSEVRGERTGCLVSLTNAGDEDEVRGRMLRL